MYTCMLLIIVAGNSCEECMSYILLIMVACTAVDGVCVVDVQVIFY